MEQRNSVVTLAWKSGPSHDASTPGRTQNQRKTRMFDTVDAHNPATVAPVPCS
jgi:hypothetical protein